MKRIVLLKSDSYYLLNQKIKEYIINPENVTKFSLNDTLITDIISDASYSGMFGTDRTIIVSDTKYFGGKFLYEEDVKALLNYLTNEQDINIIFICDDIKTSKDATKKIISLGGVVLDIKCDDINKAINEFVSSLNVSINSKAIELLIKNSNNNLDIILSEINKYSIITNNITEDIIKTYGIKIDDVNTLDFSSAVINKKFDTAFKLLEDYLKNGGEAILLIGLLTSSFVNMYIVKDAMSYGVSDEELATLLGFNNPGRLYYIKKDSKIYTMDNLKEIISNLYELDKKIKLGYNPNYTIKEFLISL